MLRTPGTRVSPKPVQPNIWDGSLSDRRGRSARYDCTVHGVQYSRGLYVPTVRTVRYVL